MVGILPPVSFARSRVVPPPATRKGGIMGRMKAMLFGGAATLLSTAAVSAADLPAMIPPAMPAPVVQDYSGWYLRGDIGFSNQRIESLDQRTITSDVLSTGLGFDSAPLFGIGAGYQFNNWLRADVTGEYRGRSNFHGSQLIPAGTTAIIDNYSGSKSEWLVLANVYVDLGTWWHVTPFIGAGIGASRNSITGFRDDGIQNMMGAQSVSSTLADDNAKWNFAWAAHAGLAYQVSPLFTVELAYRYVNLGDASTGRVYSFDGVTVTNGGPFTMKDLTSHDVKLGVRWNLFEPERPAYPAVMRKG